MYNINIFLTYAAEQYDIAESNVVARSLSIGTVTTTNVGGTVNTGAGIGALAGIGAGTELGVGAIQGVATSAVKDTKANSMLDTLQTVLDIAGFVPGLGDIMDGINVAICIFRGDTLGAVLSAIGLVPVIGSAIAVPLKNLLRAAGNADEIASAIKVLANIFGGMDKIADGLKAVMNSVVDIIKHIPEQIAGLADNGLVKKLLGNNGVEALGVMVAGLSSKVDDAISQCDEVAESVKKVVGSEGVSKSVNKQIGTASADDVNLWWKEKMGYENPPYKPGTTIKEIELTEKSTFVRVYDGENSGMYGGWVMKAEDIEGLTTEQIKDKFALPTIPKYVVDVNLEAGTHLRSGIANSLTEWGTGGGIQYDLLGQRVGEFVNERLLP